MFKKVEVGVSLSAFSDEASEASSLDVRVCTLHGAIAVKDAAAAPADSLSLVRLRLVKRTRTRDLRNRLFKNNRLADKASFSDQPRTQACIVLNWPEKDACEPVNSLAKNVSY